MIYENGEPQETTQTRLQGATDSARAALQRPACRALFTDSVDPVWLLNELSSGLSTLGSISVGNLDANKAASTSLVPNPPTYYFNPDGTLQAVNNGFANAVSIVVNSNPQSAFNAGYPSITANEGIPDAYFGPRYGASDDINRAITVIHELGHAANYLFGAGSSRILYDDTPTGVVSELNSLTVYRACFEGVQ